MGETDKKSNQDPLSEQDTTDQTRLKREKLLAKLRENTRKWRQKNKTVDHDHKSGTIRGVLCNNCNVLIGLAEENPERLQQATRYLNKHQRSQPGQQ